MNTANGLVFGWEKPGGGKWTLSGFILVSLVVHAFGFYLFQIVYPPAVALLPPPGRVSLIAANSDEGRQLLRWIEAEDPALASTTLPPPDAKALVMPTIQHAPSYLGRQPALKDLPPPPPALRIPSAHPPGPVGSGASPAQFTTKPVPTVFRFSRELESLIAAQTPALKFNATSQEAPDAARFAIAVDYQGEVRYCFLQTSSGDAGLDQQARKYLAASRFPAVRNAPSTTPGALIWGTAVIEWGNDVAPPLSAASPTPTAP